MMMMMMMTTTTTTTMTTMTGMGEGGGGGGGVCFFKFLCFSSCYDLLLTTDSKSSTSTPPSTQSRIQHQRSHACDCPHGQWLPGLPHTDSFYWEHGKGISRWPKIPGSLAQAQSKHKFEINGSKFKFCGICIKTTYIKSFSCLIHPKHLVFKSPDSHNLSFPLNEVECPLLAGNRVDHMATSNEEQTNKTTEIPKFGDPATWMQPQKQHNIIES